MEKLKLQVTVNGQAASRKEAAEMLRKIADEIDSQKNGSYEDNVAWWIDEDLDDPIEVY